MPIKIKDAVSKIKPSIESLKDDELRILYEQYVARFLSDNSRIWLTGSIMIPLAVSPFVIVFTTDNPARVMPVMAIVSVVILLFWNLFADRHRDFQSVSMAWINAIEQTMIERSGQQHPDVSVGRARFGLSVRTCRWLLCLIVAITWVILIILV